MEEPALDVEAWEVTSVIWKDDDTNLDHLAVAMLCNKQAMAAKCCAAPEVHIHAVRGKFSSHRKELGCAWIWCSR